MEGKNSVFTLFVSKIDAKNRARKYAITVDWT